MFGKYHPLTSQIFECVWEVGILQKKRPKEMASNASAVGRSVGGTLYILMRHIIVWPALWSVYIVCLDTTSIIRNCTFVLKPHLLVATSAWQPGIFIRKDRKRNGNIQKNASSFLIRPLNHFLQHCNLFKRQKQYPDFVLKCIFNPIILLLPTWKASNSLQLWNQKTPTTRFLPNPTRTVFKILVSSQFVVWLGIPQN